MRYAAGYIMAYCFGSIIFFVSYVIDPALRGVGLMVAGFHQNLGIPIYCNLWQYDFEGFLFEAC